MRQATFGPIFLAALCTPFWVASQETNAIWQSPLPSGSHTIPDANGKIVGCLPPDGEMADDQFKAECKAFIDHKKLARVAVPQHQSSWVSPRDVGVGNHPSDGATIVHVGVGVDGHVTDCTAQTAGSFDALDAQICALVRTRARFTPARDDTGQPKASNYSFPVIWK